LTSIPFVCFFFLICLKVSWGVKIDNPLNLNFVYDTGVLYSVDTCITTHYGQGPNASTVSYICMTPYHLQKQYWTYDGGYYCRNGLTNEGYHYEDYYSNSTNKHLTFNCLGNNSNVVMVYNYSYSDKANLYSCPSFITNLTYQVPSYVLNICAPKNNHNGTYFSWRCDESEYILQYEEYSDDNCTSLLTYESFSRHCNYSYSCSTFDTYCSIGYNQFCGDNNNNIGTSGNANGGTNDGVAIVIGVVVGVPIGCLFLTVAINMVIRRKNTKNTKGNNQSQNRNVISTETSPWQQRNIKEEEQEEGEGEDVQIPQQMMNHFENGYAPGLVNVQPSVPMEMEGGYRVEGFTNR